MRSADPAGSDIDPRWPLANERTFLAWSRTAFALIVGGVAAAKLADFEHELVRWIVAGPPLLAGTVLAAGSSGRFRRYDEAMREGRALPIGGDLRILGPGLALYGLVVLLAVALDG